MGYEVTLTKYAQQDFAELDGALKKKAIKALEKLKNGAYGEPLGNKHGLDLSGYHRLRFNNRRHRAVYVVVEESQLIRVIAIGKRGNEAVYKLAAIRAQELGPETQ